jgi:hypothetical protein
MRPLVSRDSELLQRIVEDNRQAHSGLRELLLGHRECPSVVLGVQALCFAAVVVGHHGLPAEVVRNELAPEKRTPRGLVFLTLWRFYEDSTQTCIHA